MSGDVWLLITGTHLALCLAPGPAVLFVLGESMNRGLRGAAQGTAGVVLANAVYFCIAASGLGRLLLASPLSGVLRWLGAGYLVYVGVQTFRASGRERGLAAPAAAEGRVHGVLRGLAVQLANPKAVVFFLVFLPRLLDAEAGVPWQILTVGVPLLLIQAFALMAYARLAEGVVLWRGAAKARGDLGRIAGALLVAIGVIVAVMPRVTK